MITGLNALIISDFTAQPLADALQTDKAFPPIGANVAPFDQVIGVLDRVAKASEHHDVIIVWTRPETTIPSYRCRVDGLSSTTEDLIRDLQPYVELLKAVAGKTRTLLVPTWTKPAYYRGMGLLECRREYGLTDAIVRLNLHLSDWLHDVPNIYLLDAQRWISNVGSKAYDPKLWYMAKVPFSPVVFNEAAQDIKAAVRASLGHTKKLIIVDLDDTLWGGAVGEIGWEALRVGGLDPIGESLQDFQRGLKSLKQRGTLLGIVSKNDEATALEALRHHPEMILRPDDFAGWRINWRDKAENICELAEELNLGLDSIVFIDDHPTERARVREALPDVVVPEMPADKMLYPKILAALPYFDKTTITVEDRHRTAQYQIERQRLSERAAMDFSSWLKNLQLEVTIEHLMPSNLKRAAQLFNKTNQFNLTTRRMSDSDLWNWAQNPDRRIGLFRARDRFGDYGLVGFVGLELTQEAGTITDFLLSCRAMGRGIEETMLAWTVQCAQELNLSSVIAIYHRTPRNRPCQEFFQNASGWEQGSADDTYIWDCGNSYPFPSHIKVTNAAVTAADHYPKSAKIL